jgi:ATP-dependent Clp protease protease subunit
MNELMSKHSGRPVEQIERDIVRDYHMSAEEAKAYGLIDNIVAHHGDIIEASKQPTVTA